MSTVHLTKMRAALARALSVDDVNQLGRATGQSKRLRTVTPHRLFLSIISGLAGSKVESLADLLREFNHQNEVTVAYKAFYNRLARPGFAKFMHAMFTRLVERLSIQTLKPEGHTAVSRFKDIVIQDGSSFALKKALVGVFPGRFTTIEPAAVEIHATYSGFSDEVAAVQIAPDKEAERQFLPAASELRDRLLLADRGYPGVEYFEAVREHGGSFIMRLSRGHDPWVRAAWVDGKRVQLPKLFRLSAFIAQNDQRRMDLDVEYERGKRMVDFRVLVLPGNEKTMTRLCTNLPRTPFSLDLVSRLYRFRWQIELLFKEWKSYANLHKFDTANEHIAAGLIWASLCAAVLKRFLAHAAQLVGGKPISTRRVAMCAGHIIDEVVMALLACVSIASAFHDGIAFLLANARRSNPKRDRKAGRLGSGLIVVGVRR
ncbi:MAG: IS4 family transposase [Gemmatimonadaceae bacterium]|nr:IS4 family transposase [Gemmatimonadaceae bacterium]